MNDQIKIYIAAPWAEKAYAKEVSKDFRAAGFDVVSRWIDFHEGTSSDGLQLDPVKLQREALNDIEDVMAADILVLLNLQARGTETSGKAVETGMALAMGKDVVMVGGPTNVFHFLDTVRKVDSIEDAIEACRVVVREEE